VNTSSHGELVDEFALIEAMERKDVGLDVSGMGPGANTGTSAPITSARLMHEAGAGVWCLVFAWRSGGAQSR
jgi:hypothetical protein